MTFSMRYYDIDGSPIDMMTWARKGSSPEKIISKTVKGDVVVSTVWLGIDHNFGLGGPPIIFETMIFGGPFDQEQWRYSTLEQAQVGHLDACRIAFGDEA